MPQHILQRDNNISYIKNIRKVMQIVFTDGLGNQMFQYAFYLSMVNKGRQPSINIGIITRNVVHNGFEICDDFMIDKGKLKLIDGKKIGGGLTIFTNRHLPFLCYREVVGDYNADVFRTKKPLVLGYWQDKRYFSDVDSKVRESFQFRNIDNKNLEIGEQIASLESVSLHIRRGDYLKHPEYHVCTPEYYDKAIEYIMTRVKTPVFYVFSDDLIWSEEFMKGRGVEFCMVGHNRGKDSYKDMYLMTRCHHNIVANSSFSWWGAWLNNYGNKIVVCPKRWATMGVKLHPQLDEWVKIDNNQNNINDD